jgi:hypothetical protein
VWIGWSWRDGLAFEKRIATGEHNVFLSPKESASLAGCLRLQDCCRFEFDRWRLPTADEQLSPRVLWQMLLL